MSDFIVTASMGSTHQYWTITDAEDATEASLLAVSTLSLNKLKSITEIRCIERNKMSDMVVKNIVRSAIDLVRL
jgi:hypothetical protein